MEGVVFDIRHYAVHDGPGIRTTVFFKGCPLRCRWCHNPEGFETGPVSVVRERSVAGRLMPITDVIGRSYTPEEVVEEVLKSRIFFDESGGGVTFSGGEPLMQPGFAGACMDLLKKEGIHIALDTSGYASRTVFDLIAGKSDLVLFDLKHYDSAVHQEHTGVPLEPVLENLHSPVFGRVGLIARIPLIPGFNLAPDTLRKMAEILLESPVVQEVYLLPYHNIATHKYERLGIDYRLKEVKVPAKEEVEMAAGIFREMGFPVKIGG